ncbi:MAG TPA: PilZ domain-containing protein [Candidatus Acidoferrales bacterium]|nr:PilZ domain-containing protein [Candidatus Acidoferrales bacterium]
MDKPDLRRHQRILVPSGHVMRVHGRDGGPPFEGVVTVIGLGGMFIRTENTAPPGTVLDVKLDDPVAAFDYECTIRHVAENGIGVEITKISPPNEQRLRFLLVQLKGASTP